VSKPTRDSTGGNDALFATIADDLANSGYSIQPNSLPQPLLDQLSNHVRTISAADFKKAGIGRDSEHHLNQVVRSDDICWINGATNAEQAWLDWAADLQSFLNRHLFLGLFSVESHFAHYAPGDCYKKHRDAFRGEANRVLSLVVYLNQGWCAEDDGELVIYCDESAQKQLKVRPDFGTVVVFLSEDFPHEVLAAQRDRFSIAAWFRTRAANTPADLT